MLQPEVQEAGIATSAVQVCARLELRLPSIRMRKTLLALISCCILSCQTAPESFVVSQRFLDMNEVDDRGEGRLVGTAVRSPAPPEVRDVGIHGDRRPSIVLKSPARLMFRGEPARQPFLQFGLAVRPYDSPMGWRLAVNGELVSEETWTPERGWVDWRVSLDAFSGQPMELELIFEGEGAEVILGHPQILERSTKRDRPNVIVYVVDCLRADHVGAYGYHLPTTPEIDDLADHSIVFEEMTACAPWTKPSTACLFTSLWPNYHQARTVDDALPREHVTLAERFRADGYVTGAWVANPVIDPRVFAFNQGFDRWVDLRSFEERAGRSNIHDLDPDAADITRDVSSWLEANHDAAFFLYLHSIDLHYGYERRPPFDDMFVSEDSTGLERDRELYDNEIAYNDRELGRLVARLKELQLYEKTILLVTADHGEEFGEHGYTRHGKSLYQQALHIPAVLKLDRSRYGGQRVAAVASNIDLAPTLLELAGIEPPDSFQGRSLVPVLEKGAESSERPVFAEVVAPQVVSYAVRNQRFKYIRNLVPEPSEFLFDLNEDREEENSLVDEPPEAAQKIIPLLERFVQLGQHGLHISVAGEPREATSVRLEVVGDDAEIATSFRFGIVTGDVFELSPDRKHLVLSMAPSDTRRHLVVRTRPEGAAIRLQLFKGTELITSRELRPEELAVTVSQAEGLLNKAIRDVLTWYLPVDAGSHQVTLDEETIRNLRALGYIN